jgi:CHRD domain
MEMKRFWVFLVVFILSGFALPNNFAADVSKAALKDEEPLFAVLLGGNEVSDSGASNAGDTNGRGSATILLEPGKRTVCFAITVSGIGTPVAAHIHQAPTGVNGGIVVTLTHPSAGNPGASSGCVNNVPAGLLNRIKNGPSAFYINVHTEDLPAGAVRGQLF